MNKVIAERMQQLSNDLLAERVVATTEGVRLRMKVRRNAYNHQSDVGVDVWTTAGGWQRAVTLPLDEAELSQHSYVTRAEEWKEAASNDLDLLEDIGQHFVTNLKGAGR